jgi:hypothetical protein
VKPAADPIRPVKAFSLTLQTKFSIFFQMRLPFPDNNYRPSQQGNRRLILQTASQQRLSNGQ